MISSAAKSSDCSLPILCVCVERRGRDYDRKRRRGVIAREDARPFDEVKLARPKRGAATDANNQSFQSRAQHLSRAAQLWADATWPA